MEKRSYASHVPAPVLRAHVILGAIQLSVGVLAFVCEIVSIAFTIGSFAYDFSGIWSSPFFIAAGICGIVAGKSVKSCTLCCVVSSLVFCILAAVLSFAALVESSIFVAVISYRSTVGFSMDVICCLLFAIELVVAIVHSAFACRASCCCVSRAEPVSQPSQDQPGLSDVGQVVFILPQAEPDVGGINRQPAFNPSFQLPTGF